MNVNAAKTLQQYLAQPYPFSVSIDEEGGYFIMFPDLPGCMTQVDEIADVSPMAEEIRTLWIETAFEHGIPIPDPTYPPTYSGKFNVRLPRSLHRALAESAGAEGVSLNQHVVAILSAGVSTSQINTRLERIESTLQSINSRLRYNVTGVPSPPDRYAHLHIVRDVNEAVAV